MSACPDKEALLHGLLDGELDAANAQACEAHLKTCAGCAQAFGELQALSARLSAPGIAYRAPPALRGRIEGLLAAEARPPRQRLRAAAPWALSAGFAALAASMAVVSIETQTLTLADQLVSSHVRSTLASHLVDVQTSDRHVVKPWFNGKIDFAPPVVDLAEEGYPLAGGRLDYIERRTTAALVYRRRAHVINLFVWPGQAPPQPELIRREGYSLIRWGHGGLVFWAVSDIDVGDLENFQKLFAGRTA